MTELRNLISLRLTKLHMSCSACPSQWDGLLDDGRKVYIRFRFGRLRVYAAPPEVGDLEMICPKYLIHEEAVGDEWDGVMGFTQVEALARLTPPADYAEPYFEEWVE